MKSSAALNSTLSAPQHQETGSNTALARNTIADNRAEAVMQRQVQEMTTNSPRTVMQRQAFGAAIGGDNRAIAHPNHTGMPDDLKNGLENISGFDLSGVKVHYNSSKPAKLNALAFAQGEHIHIASGQEKHLPHEAWHVVQQKQGRVKPTLQAYGVALNHDKNLEKEADVMGAKVLKPDGIMQAPTSQLKSISPSTDGHPIQAKLGFEIEMLVLVDDNGRPVPEKESLGRYGTHCELVVDHGPTIQTPTPENAIDAEYDVAMTEGYKRWWLEPTSTNMYENKSDAQLAHPGLLLEEFYFNPSTTTSHFKDSNVLDWEARWAHLNSGNDYTTEAAALAMHPANEITKYYHQKSTGTTQTDHPFRRELGENMYASIIEIVTDPYAPETVTGKADILQSMIDARDLANAIHAAGPTHNRVKLNTVAPGVSDRYYFGNPAQAGQTVNGSIQSNFGIALSEIEHFVEKTINDNQGGQIAGYTHPTYKVKHHTDVVDNTHDEGDVVRAELVAASADASTIINAIPNPTAVPLSNLKGLMIIVCQYLRFGKIFYNNGYDGTGYPLNPTLVKNMIPLMARTDMSIMFNTLVPANEQAVFNANLGAIITNILAVTGRHSNKALLNDPTEQTNENALAAWGAIYSIGCGSFLNNVFTQAQDGVTTNLGNIRTMSPEKVDGTLWTYNAGPPAHYAHPLHPNQPHRPATYKEGAVFELRNMIPNVVGRFVPNTWPGIARYFSAFLELQHVGAPPPLPPAPVYPALPPIPPPIPVTNNRCCCFITTACTQSRGLPDDCEELTVLRSLRDNYIKKLEKGESLIEQYYAIAPRIVAAIDSSPNAKKIYEDLYQIVCECVALVKANKPDDAVKIYKLMIVKLANQYLS